MHSIISYPERGPWGQSSYRGNCSGHVYRELFESLRPSHFIDPTVGSGTSIEVAREMGIDAVGLDLRHGFNGLDALLDKAIEMLEFEGTRDDEDQSARVNAVDKLQLKLTQALKSAETQTDPGSAHAFG